MTPLEWWGLADRGARMTDKDRLLVLALREYEAGLCRGECGQHKSESMNPAYDGSPDAVAKYVVGEPWECFACAAIGNARSSFEKALSSGEHANHGQYQWGVQLISMDALNAASQ